MFDSEQNIYLQEKEIKPNKNAIMVLIFLFFGALFCWVLNEIGIFRVGDDEMRTGSIVTLASILAVLLLVFIKKDMIAKPITKWLFFGVCTIFTFTTNTLLTFHTTIMLLFPIFYAMLYRSKKLGAAACAASFFCTIVTPVLGYVLGAWDVPLLEELIWIATKDYAPHITEWTTTVTLVNVGKIILYLVLPRLIMVGSCSLLMFHVIKLGNDNIDNQVLLDRLSHKDMVTDLYNRNYFDEACKDKFNGTIGVIFFDVNDLKKANDANGHEYGDLLLKRSAKSLLNVCDKDTYAFRYGGDEFILVIKNATDEKIERKIVQWRDALDRVNFENGKEYNGLHCSLAYGYAMGNFENIKAVLHEADDKMYQNKVEMKKSAN